MAPEPGRRSCHTISPSRRYRPPGGDKIASIDALDKARIFSPSPRFAASSPAMAASVVSVALLPALPPSPTCLADVSGSTATSSSSPARAGWEPWSCMVDTCFGLLRRCSPLPLVDPPPPALPDASEHATSSGTPRLPLMPL
ncbi:hypothetical protein ACQJBY_007461 [Aegilops geniculata]